MLFMPPLDMPSHNGSPLPGDRGSYITLVGLFSNIALTLAKGLAGWYMHSASLLADAGHSMSGASRAAFPSPPSSITPIQTYWVTSSLFSVGACRESHLQKRTHMVLQNLRPSGRQLSLSC